MTASTRPRVPHEVESPPYVRIPVHIRSLVARYDRARLDALEAGDATVPAHYAGRRAWRSGLPFLDTRSNIQCFIACVAVGFATEMLDSEDAKTLLYNAQMALATMAGAK